MLQRTRLCFSQAKTTIFCSLIIALQQMRLNKRNLLTKLLQKSIDADIEDFFIPNSELLNDIPRRTYIYITLSNKCSQTYTNSTSPIRSGGDVHSTVSELFLMDELCPTAFCITQKALWYVSNSSFSQYILCCCWITDSNC